MIEKRSYQAAFICALLLHILMAFFLLKKPENKTYALSDNMPKHTPHEITPAAREEKIIKAKNIDQQEVLDTVNRLKAERLKAQQAQEQKQRELALQAEKARKKRIDEQKRLQQLKKETEKLALARKKALAEEDARLKKLAQQKVAEEKRLADLRQKKQALQKQQEAEAKRLAEFKKKHKALIVHAISQQWILPDNVDRGLSSQFRIRLAPDGSVLDVSLIHSSGDPVLDRTARAAIYKASPLPVPREPDAFNVFRDISLTVRPENARG